MEISGQFHFTRKEIAADTYCERTDKSGSFVEKSLTSFGNRNNNRASSSLQHSYVCLRTSDCKAYKNIIKTDISRNQSVPGIFGRQERRKLTEYRVVIYSMITSTKSLLLFFYEKTSVRASQPYGPRTWGIWLQQLWKQTDNGNSPSLTAETHCSTRTRICAFSLHVASAKAR